MRDTVIQAQQAFWAALKTKDKQIFERVLTNDFMAVGSLNQSRAEFIRVLTSFPVEIISVNAENLQVHHFDNMAVLTGIQVAQLRLPDGSEATNKIAITNVFRYDGDHWSMVLAHPVEIT